MHLIRSDIDNITIAIPADELQGLIDGNGLLYEGGNVRLTIIPYYKHELLASLVPPPLTGWEVTEIHPPTILPLG